MAHCLGRGITMNGLGKGLGNNSGNNSCKNSSKGSGAPFGEGIRQTLAGKTVVLAITGSIAAVEVVKLARALRRKGAKVQAVMSDAAAGIITPDAVTYACDTPAITKITGNIEHVKFCGIGGIGDVLLIAPATANTISKIACGIDDTPVTTFATTAIGRGMPVVIAPAMHESMYNHPAVVENMRKLKGFGISFVDPFMAENKAKFASNDEIVLEVERAVCGKPLLNKKVIITGGACREALDDVRVLTTRSGGRMGRELALEAYRLGADVTYVHGGEGVAGVRNVITESAEDMQSAVLNAIKGGCDFYISAAAVSDYKPERIAGKISSNMDISVKLLPLPKILDAVVNALAGAGGGAKIAAFKLGDDADEKAEKMVAAGIDLVCANAAANMGAEGGRYGLHTKDGVFEVCGTKEETAGEIWRRLL